MVHLDAGSTYDVTRGELVVTLRNEHSTANTVTLSTRLAPTGAGGQFSYRLAVPQQYLPATHRQDDALAVSDTSPRLHFASITVDGVEAQPLDSAQTLFSTSFSNRVQEHRLDLAVTLPQADSDGDQMPDWWEEANGLNPLFAGDATSDADNDGWDALTEFRSGGDPNVSDNAATVATGSPHCC